MVIMAVTMNIIYSYRYDNHLLLSLVSHYSVAMFLSVAGKDHLLVESCPHLGCHSVH
jgi:hypothetical protein